MFTQDKFKKELGPLFQNYKKKKNERNRIINQIVKNEQFKDYLEILRRQEGLCYNVNKEDFDGIAYETLYHILENTNPDNIRKVLNKFVSILRRKLYEFNKQYNSPVGLDNSAGYSKEMEALYWQGAFELEEMDKELTKDNLIEWSQKDYEGTRELTESAINSIEGLWNDGTYDLEMFSSVASNNNNIKEELNKEIKRENFKRLLENRILNNNGRIKKTLEVGGKKEYKRVQFIIDLFYNEMSQESIGEKYEVTQQLVQKRIEDMIKKIKEEFTKEELEEFLLNN